MRTRMLYLAVLALGVLPGCPGGIHWGTGSVTPTASLKASAIGCDQTSKAVAALIQANKLKGDAAEAATVLVEQWLVIIKEWRAAIALGQYAGGYEAQASTIQDALLRAQVQAQGATP